MTCRSAADGGDGGAVSHVDGTALDAASRNGFVRRMTTVQRTPLVPEIALHLADRPQRIFRLTEELTDPPGQRLPPFWAFAWPGGQGLARHLLDHPEATQGKRVIDVGAGSGIAAIAAYLRGAADVLAADIDDLAETAIGLNAVANCATVRTTTADVLAAVPEADLVLIGDLVYEPSLASRVAGFLDGLMATGIDVLLADRTTARRPPMTFELVADYLAPVIPELIDDSLERARVWRLVRRPRRRRGA